LRHEGICKLLHLHNVYSSDMTESVFTTRLIVSNVRSSDLVWYRAYCAHNVMARAGNPD